MMYKYDVDTLIHIGTIASCIWQVRKLDAVNIVTKPDKFSSDKVIIANLLIDIGYYLNKLIIVHSSSQCETT